MSTVATLLAGNAFAIVCAIAGAVLAYKQREGWGWFLFVASASVVSVPTLLKLT